jgi:asparagine synthase (glutamine-hydrolysing)
VCGIAGFTHRDRQPGRSIIRCAVDSIRHRGPDQQGIYESPDISLGAVRLRILDLEQGDQPFRSGSSVIAFNGEIYNYRELRRDLEDRGHRFETDCDTEVVLHSWLQWQSHSLERLHGMFAFAIWDERERRLVLARDRLGIKPLYVCHRNGEIHFGSELKAIFAHPDVDRTIDPEGLRYFLALNYIPQPYTMVAGITKLRPGCWLEWRDGRAAVTQYWTPEFRPDSRMAIEEATSRLDQLLDRSVREHLLSDVPIGVWLSGGLDSSAITHYASRHCRGKLKTFSVSFGGRSFDESPYFREVARAYGTDHHELDLSPDSGLPEAIECIAAHSDEPSADAGALPVWFLSRMTRRHVTVALSGEGADEIFGGYQTYLAARYARWLRLIPISVRRTLLNLSNWLPVSDDKIAFEYKVKRFLAGSVLDPIDAHVFWNGSGGGAGIDRLFSLPECGGFLNRFIYLDHLLYLPDDILNKCDRMSMAHSLEVRPPFLDHRIVEFAATLPENFKVRGSTLKYVLRRLMRDKLPPAVIQRKKEGFDIPAHHWLRTSLKPFLADTLTQAGVAESGVLDWPQVDRLVRDHFARRANNGYQLWGLLILFLWIKRWKVEPPN